MKKRPGDFEFELSMELSGKPDKKKLEDTLDFYRENLPLNAVEKLMSESKNSNTESKEVNNLKSSYSKFISAYNENDDENVKIDDVKKEMPKRQKRYERTDAASEFLNDIKDSNEAFDYDYTRPKSSIGKLFIATLFIVFLCIIAALVFKINFLNNQIEEIKMTAQDNSQAKQKLQEVLIENENMKKMIEDLSNNQVASENSEEKEIEVEKPKDEPKTVSSAPSQTEYIVQTGDTLSSISKKFYGTTNLYNKIMEKNNLKSENLSEGQKLIIPEK